MGTRTVVAVALLAAGCTDYGLWVPPPGEIAVQPQLNFQVGELPETRNVAIQNIGQGELELFELNLLEAGGLPLLYELGADLEGAMLLSGETVQLPVAFSGTASSMGTLEIHSSDPDDPVVEVALSTEHIWAHIHWPPPDTWKTEGQPFDFKGRVGETVEFVPALTVRWSSDLDGTLFEGRPDVDGYTSFETDALRPGDHTVTLMVEDSASDFDSDSVRINVLDCEDDVDYDGDGWSAMEGDCDDHDPDVFPGQSMDLGDVVGACQGGEVVIIHGEEEDDHFGFSFGDPGDMNGDGLPDVVIGARDFKRKGGAYIIFGRSDGWATHVDASELVRLKPSAQGDDVGHNTTAVVDMNGDGIDEVMVGSKHGDGLAWVWFGREEWGNTNSDAADLILSGDDGAEDVGEDMASADFDGDGYGDIVLGGTWFEQTGRIWVVRGGDAEGDFDLADAHLSITGEDPSYRFGNAVASAGDTNGDGVADLLVAAELGDQAGPDSGAVYLFTDLEKLFGKLNSTSRTAVWTGEAEDDKLGTHDMVSRAGDVNQDGFSDLLFVAAGHDGSSDDVGKVYLVLGSPAHSGTYRADEADYSWVGDGGGDLGGGQGEGLAYAGDVDGDGVDDFLVGADDDDHAGENAGRIYLFLGGNLESWGDEVRLTRADRLFHGLSDNSGAGRAVTGVGDLDANGIGDFIVGAHSEEQGTAYLYLNDYGYCPEDTEE